MTIVPLENHCRKCGEIKPASDFHRDGAQKNGLHPYCKTCMKRYYEANVDRQRANARAWNRAHPERVRAHVRDYWHRHPDARKKYPPNKERQRARRRTEKFRAASRAYYRQRRTEDRAWPQRKKVDPATKTLQNHRRRARLAQAKGQYAAHEWQALCAWFGHQCLACGSTEITVDHVIPLEKRGPNTISNLQPLCKPCNSSKGINTTDYRDPEQLRLFLESLS
jgi:5-methylcytosine-specific restriction endonuclease McrA